MKKQEKDNLRIHLLQSSPIWEDKIKNFQMYSKTLNSITSSDIIVLPEMFQTGFTTNVIEMAEPTEGMTLKWMRQISKKKNALVIGSFIVKERENYFNRLVVVYPNGKYNFYDKRHLFALAKEDKIFTSGTTKREVIEYKGWRIFTLICYDLRFPVWSANQRDYDLLIYVASWPEKRSYAWRHLLISRAIENMCYVLGVNRVGEDLFGIKHNGDSLAINPMGSILAKPKDNTPQVIQANLSLSYLKNFRKKFPFLKNQDRFTII